MRTLPTTSLGPPPVGTPALIRLPFGAWTSARALLAAGLAAVTIVLALATILGGTIGGIVLPLLGIEAPAKLFGAANSVIEKATMMAVGVLGLAVFAGPRIASHFGLGAGRWPRVIAAGVAGAVAINLALALFESSVGRQGASTGAQLKDFGLGSGAATDLCLIAAIVILAPVAEEYLFRALLHKGARDGLARWLPRVAAIAVATAISSLVFVQIHLDPAQVGYWPIYLVFGLACALAYELTGSLAAPILVHALNNGWAFFRGASGGDAAFSWPWLYVVLALAPVAAVALSLGIGRLLGDRAR